MTFIVDQTHQRNIEVHTWINPYRARVSGATYELAPNHMAKRFRHYATQIWMNPGSLEVQDIVNRYAVDGIHIDDYFYPYSDETDFPDNHTYVQYQQQGGTLNISDWRRAKIKFGIWKSGSPEGITGLSSCDSRLFITSTLLAN